MTLLACQIFSTIAHEGSFARTAEQLHLTPSAISHAVSTMEAECGFPLFTRTKSGVTMTAAAENLLPAIQRLLASSESLDQSIAQINGMHKGVLRLGVFNSACVTWLPQLVPQFQLDFPGIDVQIYQGSYADICAWVKNGTAEIGFLSNSSALIWILNRYMMTSWSASHPRPTARPGPAVSAPRNCAASRSSASWRTWMPISRATSKPTTCGWTAAAISWMTSP